MEKEARDVENWNYVVSKVDLSKRSRHFDLMSFIFQAIDNARLGLKRPEYGVKYETVEQRSIKASLRKIIK